MGHRERLLAALRGPRQLHALTRSHVLGVIGSGWVTVTLASSLFFRLTPGASQAQVVRYLAITLLPMAALTPLLGPLLDRHVTNAVTYAVRSNQFRGLCCLALALTLGSTAFYAVALALLVGNKAYSVSKCALLPRLVPDHDQLVAANSRISKWSAVSAALATGAGVALDAVVGPRLTLCVAAGAFLLAASAARRVPLSPAEVGCSGRRDAAPAKLQPSLRLRAAALEFTAIRAAVGLFAFGAAFAMRRSGASGLDLAVAGGLYGAGSFAGNVFAPWARRRTGEERMLEACLAATIAACLLTVTSSSTHVVPLVAATLGCAASLGRLAFDSVLQASTADGNRGRAYARFETRLQVGWVVGALAAATASLALRPTVAVVAVVLCWGAAHARVIDRSGQRRLAFGLGRTVAAPHPVAVPAASAAAGPRLRITAAARVPAVAPALLAAGVRPAGPPIARMHRPRRPPDRRHHAVAAAMERRLRRARARPAGGHLSAPAMRIADCAWITA